MINCPHCRGRGMVPEEKAQEEPFGGRDVRKLLEELDDVAFRVDPYGEGLPLYGEYWDALIRAVERWWRGEL